MAAKSPPRHRYRETDDDLIRSALVRAIDWTQASARAELGDHPQYASKAARVVAEVERRLVRRYQRLLARLSTSPRSGRTK